jgi:hypothetical protein
MVAAEKSLAFAPAAASGDDLFSGWREGFNDVVSLVGDELGVEAENGAEGTFDLCRSVVASLQDAHGRFDEGMKRGNIGVGGEADVEFV